MHFIQWRTIRLWYFLLSMHHVDSPWIESMVLETFWNLFSKEDSRESPEIAPAAMSGGAPSGHFHSKNQLNFTEAST